MAGIPLTPYEGPRFSDIIGISRNNLDNQLARERMIVEEARQRQIAAAQEKENERRYQQQMAVQNLNEMKFAYDKEQNQPGGLSYLSTMANIEQSEAAMRNSDANAARTRDEMENPSKYWKPTSTGSSATRTTTAPKLTQAQIDQNESDYANNRPLTYPVPQGSAINLPASDPVAAGPAAYDTDLPAGNSAAVDPYAVLDSIPPGTPDPAASGGGTDLFPPPNAPVSNEPPVLNTPPAAPVDGLLPAPNLPRDDARARIQLAKERDKRITDLNKQIATLTKSASEARSSAGLETTDTPEKKTFNQSAALFAAQLQQKQQELRNIIAPQLPSTDENGETSAMAATVTAQPAAVNQSPPAQPPLEVPSFRERNQQDANALINTQWDAFKESALKDLEDSPKGKFTALETAMVRKSITQGERMELAEELFKRGSPLVKMAPITGMGEDAPYLEAPTFIQMKAPNGRMVDAFEVLKMTLEQPAGAAKEKPSKQMPPDVQARVDAAAKKLGL